MSGEGKVFASNSQYTFALASADGYVLTPLIYSADYIDFLIGYAKKNDISAIIPLFDVDAAVLAKNKVAFEAEGIFVITGTAEGLSICNDKWKTYRFLSEHSIPAPQTYLHPDDCLEALARKEISYPVILKPRWGMGSIGIYSADNREELDVFTKKLRREIFKTYLKYESVQDQNNCIVFQEKLNGPEFGLDVINDLNGNYVITSVKRKLAMRAGETDIAITTKIPALEEIGHRLSGLMRHQGNLDVDCFMVGQSPYVLEMNCRFGGQFPFSYLAGVDLPRQIILWLQNKGTDLDLLTPKSEVLAAKELSPVAFKFALGGSDEKFLITVNTASADELEKFYKECDDYFQPPLRERMDFHAMAQKNRAFGFSVESRFGNELIGLVLGYANNHIDDSGYIPFVIVKKEFRGQGLAKKLLKAAFSYAKSYGMRSILLTADNHNIMALKLYFSCGFHEVKREELKIYLQKDL